MKLDGGLQFTTDVKEALLQEMEAQRCAAGIEITPGRVERIERKEGALVLHMGEEEPVRARRVIVAIGRSGNFRKLGVPGEELDKVYNRLFDPKEFAEKNALVVGGDDSALETAIALTKAGAKVTLSYRRKELSRAKPENIEKIEMLARDANAEVQVERPSSDRVNSAMTSGMGGAKGGALKLALGTEVSRIEPAQVFLKNGTEAALPNDVVFTMLGREAPLEFFRRSGLQVRGDWHLRTWISCLAFVVFCVLLYHWKSNHPIEFPVQQWANQHHAFPYNVPKAIASIGGKIREWSNRDTNLLYTIKRGLGNPAFYYTLAYCTCVFVFGIRRIRRRRTPYVTVQTIVLICSQCLPLFILPEILLPWAGRNGWFEPGHPLHWLANQLFESYDGSLGHERAYWRAYGFILAFPLNVYNVYNVFTDHPMWLWLGSRLCRPSSSSRSSSSAGGKARIAAGSAPAARSRKRWGTLSARRCRTDRSGTA